MKKIVLIASSLLIVSSLALTSCGSKASDATNQEKTECCGGHSKEEGKSCCDSTKVNSPADSIKKEGCCSGKEQKEPCDKPCEHKH
ncbi:hypothetical protein [Tenuifilum sp.]|uniref:hypothetical protein n=1 Tax=Tenuifilum sp. TaxID=2760880 RepID=UPI001B53A501|nr:hypothetical protein [Bacteroidales bacterium]HOK87062.1 hypothetical protein [Tenuifilum sp.]HPP91210.1 hypothetical protein [Tenuifilum sp.]HQE55553.1 hypothetical protein [Tenuifilum sp.]HQG73517.1 hypothetical protein [Tenuifilum sp.]